ASGLRNRQLAVEGPGGVWLERATADVLSELAPLRPARHDLDLAVDELDLELWRAIEGERDRVLGIVAYMQDDARQRLRIDSRRTGEQQIDVLEVGGNLERAMFAVMRHGLPSSSSSVARNLTRNRPRSAANYRSIRISMFVGGERFSSKHKPV